MLGAWGWGVGLLVLVGRRSASLCCWVGDRLVGVGGWSIGRLVLVGRQTAVEVGQVVGHWPTSTVVRLWVCWCG